ncbi:MAG: hypothetical protein V3T88_01885 [Nitrosomonadaceae bacterium]|jgi:hypothetical protein
MVKKTIFFVFIVIVSFWTVSGSSQQLQPLLSGDGWRLVRSVQLGNSGKYIHMVLVELNRDTDIAVYGAALNKICRSEPDFCRVRFWNEERYVPKSISFTEGQFKTLRAEYTFNRAGGVQEMRYACTVLPNEGQCFSN